MHQHTKLHIQTQTQTKLDPANQVTYVEKTHEMDQHFIPSKAITLTKTKRSTQDRLPVF